MTRETESSSSTWHGGIVGKVVTDKELRSRSEQLCSVERGYKCRHMSTVVARTKQVVTDKEPRYTYSSVKRNAKQRGHVESEISSS